MNVSATADNAYRNAKIPFAYNYPTNSNVVTGSNLHGAHVAGIAAGNSVSVSDGVISGVAPEAQILFFGVLNSQGGTQSADIIAAAVVVAYYSVDLPDGNSGLAYPLFLIARDTAEEIKSNAQTLKYTNAKAIVQRANSPRENMYSSYGYGDNLDITIDFSAPGGNIYSSYNGTTGFASLSGTSMAAPQVTGATSLMYQYAEEAFPAYTGAAKVMLVKNLLASTAETVYHKNGAVSSPRKVGSGVIQLDKAMETAVILKAKNSDETKINLGADLSKTFDVTFTAYNLGKSDVTFDDVSVDVSSDDYKYYATAGYVYSGAKKLQASISGDNTVSVPVGGSVDVTVSVTLSDEDVAYLETAMTNGFFIDGKVTLSGSENCDVGIPFSGFYGNWAKLSIMNERRVLDYFSLMGYSDDGFMPPAQILKENSQLVMPIADEVSADVKDIPAAVFANPVRNAFMTVKVDGVVVVDGEFINKFYDLGYYMNDIVLGDLSDVSTITVELRLPYDTEGKNIQSFTINTVADNTAPVISDVYVSEKTDGDYASVVVSDNYGVSTITTVGLYDGLWYYSDAYIKNTSATAEFDITGFDNIHYYVYDCAFNMTALEPHVGIDVDEGVALYTNNTHKALTGECMIAVYEGGKMTEFKKLSSKASEIEAYDTLEFDVSEYEGKKYKLFFWSDMTNIVPVCDAYEK